MPYKRHRTRAPRAIEQTEAMRELVSLRTRAEALALRNSQLVALVKLKDLEIEKLLHDKIAIATDLSRTRLTIDFLEGRNRWTA